MKRVILFKNKKINRYFIFMCFVCFLALSISYFFTYILDYSYQTYHPSFYTFIFSFISVFFGVVFLMIVYLLGQYYQQLYQRFYYHIQQELWQEKQLSYATIQDIKTHYYQQLFQQLKNIDTKQSHSLHLEGLEATINQYQNEYSQNMIMNTILSYKLSLPENQDIIVESDIHVSSKTFLSDIDLSSLMFNLIDNAINATKLCQQPFIRIHIEEKYHCLKVQIENSYDPKQIIERKSGHGYGLKIIRDIVAAYHGDITLKQEDGWFDVTIFLYEGESQ